MPTYKILRTYPTDENTEIRLAEISRGRYSVGVWDNDESEYYPVMKIYKTIEAAEGFFESVTKMAKRTTSVQLSKEQSESLEELARRWGFFQTRGTGTGKIGSISKLVQAIADGKLIIKNQGE